MKAQLDETIMWIWKMEGFGILVGCLSVEQDLVAKDWSKMLSRLDHPLFKEEEVSLWQLQHRVQHHAIEKKSKWLLDATIIDGYEKGDHGKEVKIRGK